MQDKAKAAAAKANQRTPAIPSGLDTPRLRAAKADADAAAIKSKDAQKNRDALEKDRADQKARQDKARQDAEAGAKPKPGEPRKDNKAEADANAKRKADEEAAAAAKKKKDDEEAEHSRDVDAHKETMTRRGARYLVGASFLTGFPFPFPGAYGRRGRRPPLSYGVDKSPKTPAGLPTDLFSTARPEDIFNAAVLDGKQDGYAYGFADGKEGGRGAVMKKEVPLRDPTTMLNDVLASRISTKVQLERQAFCVIKLAEVQVKGLNYIDAYPQCIDDTGKPAAAIPAPANPTARDLSGQGAYTNGYKQEFVAQYNKGYNAGFIRGREEALAGISGAPISGAPSGPSGPSGASGASGASGPISGAPSAPVTLGPSGPLKGEGGSGVILEQAGGDNPYPDGRPLYDSDSDEENFLTKDEFLYLLAKGVNKQRLNKIRKAIEAS